MNGYAKDKKFDFVYIFLLTFSVSLFLILTIIANKSMIVFGIQLDAAALIFPIVFVISDIVSEVYGYKYSRIISFISAVCGLFMFALFSFSISMSFDLSSETDVAFKTLFEFSPFVIGISLFSFLICDFVNDILFEKMKKAKKTNFAFRAISTSFIAHLMDSVIIFIPFSLVLWGYTIKDIPKLLIESVFIGSIMKIVVEIVFLPISIYVVKKLSEKRKCRE